MDHDETTIEPAGESTAEPIDWGDQQPDPVWLDLYEQGLVRPPYRGPNSHEIAKIIAERKPINFKGTTEDILRALGRELEPGGVAAAVDWHEENLLNLDAQQGSPHQHAPDHPKQAVLPPRVKFKGTTEDILRALGRLPEPDLAAAVDSEYAGPASPRGTAMDAEETAAELNSETATESIDWGDEQPDEVWLDLYQQGLVHPPYQSKRTRPKLSELPPRIKFKGTTEDILRALGRI